MRHEPHPISGFTYQAIEGGRVRVTNPVNGMYGVFKWDGEWIEGDVTHADLHFLRFVGGPDMPPEKDILWGFFPTEGAETPPAFAYAWGNVPEGMTRVVGKYIPAPGVQSEQGPRSQGMIPIQEVLAHDNRPELIPDAYKLESPLPGGPVKIPTDRFHDPKYHKLEVELLWKKVWQVACHVDEIPDIGDYHVYNIASLTWLIVRTAKNEIKAYQNVCLHRGRALADCDGKKAREFRCPFHGWTWNLDGTIKHITSEWDFPGVREESRLPEAKVATWGGFIFINPDPDAMPLEEFLGPVMLDHYRKLKLENRVVVAHVSRRMPANWKTTGEAFMEAYHVVATHPQLLLFGFDFSLNRYDVFGHWGRADNISSGASSPHRSLFAKKEDVIAGWKAQANTQREYLRGIIGEEVEQYSDTEMADICFNDLFPNFHPWTGWSGLNFRFRPEGDNPESTMMDVWLTMPWPSDKPKPPKAKHRILADDQPWADAHELGTLARIIDQDVGNLRSMQKGLKAKSPPYVWYSAYQESKIRNFHEHYDRWLKLEK